MSSTGSSFEFDEFVLDTSEKILLRNGDAVPITPKVFELLLVLVENHGHIVEKETLMDRVWTNSFVEDSNLTFTIRQLRKLLGDDTQNPRFIETVPKRGYRFVAKTVERVAAAATPDLRSPISTPAAESDPSIHGLQKFRPFRRYLFLAGFLLISGVIVVTIYSFWSKARNSAGTGNIKIQRLTSNGKTKVAVISPDGKFLAYVAGEEGSQSLWLRNIAAGGDLEVLPAAGKSAINNIAFSPDGNYLYYTSGGVLSQLPVLGGMPKTTSLKFGGSFSFSPDGGQIAFLRYRSEGEETADLIVAATDGSGERVVASSKRPNIFLRSPAWSPDGKVIACTAMTAAGSQEVVTVSVSDGYVSPQFSPLWSGVSQIVWQPDGSGLLAVAIEEKNILSQIWLLPFPNGTPRKITDDSHNYQTISLPRDGNSMVAVRAEEEVHLWLAPIGDASQIRQLTSGFEKYDGVFSIVWTERGRIIYGNAPSGRQAIWQVDADGRGEKELSSEGGSTGATPDGNVLVFQIEDGERTGLFRLNTQNGEKARLTTGTDVDATVSGDGKWVVFTRYGGDVALWKVPIDGGSAVKLTTIAGYPRSAAISPDGKFIAFVRGGSGKTTFPALAVVAFDGGAIIKEFEVDIEVPQNYGKTALQWTPDGQGINFVAVHDNVSNIWRQPVDGGFPIQVTNFTDRRIFNFAYSPDGEQLALSRGTLNRDVILISNFQ